VGANYSQDGDKLQGGKQENIQKQKYMVVKNKE
jgi:hypothetical protein